VSKKERESSHSNNKMSKKEKRKKETIKDFDTALSYIFKVNFDQNENKFLILKMLFINSELTMELSPCNSKTLRVIEE
jgi:hypothetical protein